MDQLLSLNKNLTDASNLLGVSAENFRDVDFNKSENLKRIETALTYIFEIRHEIYKVRPDLKPDFLKTEWN